MLLFLILLSSPNIENIEIFQKALARWKNKKTAFEINCLGGGKFTFKWIFTRVEIIVKNSAAIWSEIGVDNVLRKHWGGGIWRCYGNHKSRCFKNLNLNWSFRKGKMNLNFCNFLPPCSYGASMSEGITLLNLRSEFKTIAEFVLD